MKDNQYYLKPNVVLEPLIDGWYAWTHLVYPPTAALNMISRHFKIMGSYIQAPHVHAAAVKNPKMLGGPFMNFNNNRAKEIQSLMEATKAKRKRWLELAQAIKELDAIISRKKDGFSLESLYDEVPEPLRGLVELSYDLHNNAGYRFFDQLLYKSEYYIEDAQHISMWLTNNDERPFVLSTPRLGDEESINIEIPFSSPAIDELHRLRKRPASYEHIKRLIGCNAKDEKLLHSFLTTEEPLPYEKYTGDKVRMRYFGHACILIETKDVTILVDPVISYYGYQTDVSRFSYSDLPDEIDYVLITHNHQDHILFETMLSLRHRVKTVIVPEGNIGSLADPNLKLILNQIGFSNVVSMEEMEEIKFHNCSISGLPFLGEHGDLDVKTKLCYVVKVDRFSMLFMADSCNLEPRLYDRISALIDPIDVIFLGMECDGAPYSWVYGPLIMEEVPRDKDNSRRLAGSNFVRGRSLVDTFKPKELYVYAMGLEPWLEFISSVRYREDAHPIVASNQLIEYCRDRNIIAERLYGEKEILYSLDAELVSSPLQT